MSKLIHIPSHLDALHQVGDLVNPAMWNFPKLAMALLQPHQVLPPMLIYTEVLIKGLDFLLRQVNLPCCLKAIGIAIDAQPRKSPSWQLLDEGISKQPTPCANLPAYHTS